MESITRNVSDIEPGERRFYEGVLGHALRDDQQIVIRVLETGREPDDAERRAAIDDVVAIARRGRANAAAQGVTPAQIDDAIDEAIRHARRSSG